MEYRPLEGFVLRRHAVQLHRHRRQPVELAGADGQHGASGSPRRPPRSRPTTCCAAPGGRPPGRRRSTSSPAPAPAIGDAALASPELAGIHFTGSTAVFKGMWKTVGDNIGRYRNYPRIVGETGGKDFIVAHPSADVEALATAIVRGSFEYQGQKCSAASRVYAPSNLWPELRERLGQRGRRAEDGRRRRLLELHGRRHRRRLVPDTEGGDRGGARGRSRDRRRRRLRRQRGLLRRADRDRDRGPRLPD